MFSERIPLFLPFMHACLRPFLKFAFSEAAFVLMLLAERFLMPIRAYSQEFHPGSVSGFPPVSQAFRTPSGILFSCGGDDFFVRCP